MRAPEGGVSLARMSGENEDVMTRRQAVVGVSATVAGAVAVSTLGAGASPAEAGSGAVKTGSGARLPTVFLPHGGGPWPFVEVGFGERSENDALRKYLEGVSAAPRTPPKALLVISAHWEERVPTVMTHAKPPLFFDYYGFPPESYQLTWPAPGDPALAARVQALLGAAGFKTGRDAERGFDHGTFVPLKLAYPKADVPTVQLSLKTGLDPAEHMAMGRALAPLRDEGVFIVGSGMTFHNMRGFMNPQALGISEEFDGWLRETATLVGSARTNRLLAWAKAPQAKICHPREEHLLPLMVVAGAAEQDAGQVTYAARYAGVALSGYQFG